MMGQRPAMRLTRRTFQRAPVCFRRRPIRCLQAPSIWPLPIERPSASRAAECGRHRVTAGLCSAFTENTASRFCSVLHRIKNIQRAFGRRQMIQMFFPDPRRTRLELWEPEQPSFLRKTVISKFSASSRIHTRQHNFIRQAIREIN